jgi:amino acid permease
MKNNYNDAVILLALHIATILILMGGQLLDVHWSFTEENRFGRMLTHPGLVAIHLFFSTSLLFLFWLKNEKTYKLMRGIALAACIYGLFLAFAVSIGIDFVLAFGAGRLLRFGAPVALNSEAGVFSKPTHRADGN